MSSKVQRVTIGSTPGGGPFSLLTMGAAASVGIRPPAILGSVELQALAMSRDTFKLSVPAVAAGQTSDVNYEYIPQGFPTSFILVGGASGLIIADVNTPVLYPNLGILGVSQSLEFGLGPPQVGGSTLWTIQPNQKYQLTAITGAVRFFSAAGSSAQTVQMVGWAVLLCKPPTVS